MLSLQPATFEEFEREAARGSVVPVVRAVLADLQTPVGAFLRVARGEPHAFLLESVEGGERLARYSFLGARPEMIVRGRGASVTVERAGETETHEGVNAVEFLRHHFAGRRLAEREGLSPFAGGAVGFLAYDAARWFEPSLDAEAGEEKSAEGKSRASESSADNSQSEKSSPDSSRADKSSPGDAEADEAVFMLFRTALAFDRVRQRIEITSVVFADEAAGSRERLRALYEEAVRETARVEEQLFAGGPARERRAASPDETPTAFVPHWTREGFERAVESIKERIAAGDCYQAVLSQRFSARVRAEPLEIYRALRATNPSPYMFFLRAGALSVVGASPEMLVRCRGRRLEYRPIAGTRPRGATEAEDARLAAEMRADEKEVAEHTMLVDLGRNDLGRVAEYGSVKVNELMTVERYSHVQHLVTGLSATLREGADRFDALAACFPAGTVSGAPKVSAMRIIRALEPEPRGIYAGSVLYLDYAGNLDSCIAIRTIFIGGGRAVLQAGAGIVADSVPASEYEETINKARALVRAVELAERGL